jgi:iron complex transport system substrate-binding protein
VKISRRTRLASTLAVLSLVAVACGDDDHAGTPEPAADAGAAAAPATDAPAAAPGTDSPNITSPATVGDAVPATDGPAATVSAEAFPVTIEHKYGGTTIESRPERIVVVGFAEHEGLLAVGAEPVAVRDWYGDQPYATWPWAQDELGDLQPAVLAADALNFEQIAALDPDVILGVNSGMTDSDYATLAAIAPTVAQPAEYPDYATPWDVMLEIDARATGYSAEAAALIADTKAKLAAVAAAHPEWAGQTAAVAFVFQDQPGAYASGDARANLLAGFGLTTPAEFDELAGDQFYFTVSGEEISKLDADVIVWLADGDAAQQQIRDLPLRTTLMASVEGREIVADPLLGGAFSHGTPLSLDYVIEQLVPELELALDGDPATAVPSAAVLDANG